MNGINRNKDKYVMCAGKYNKDGWTMVFKAKSIREAEELLSINSARRELAKKKDDVNSLEFIEQTAREKLDMYYPNERVYVDKGM